MLEIGRRLSLIFYLPRDYGDMRTHFYLCCMFYMSLYKNNICQAWSIMSLIKKNCFASVTFVNRHMNIDVNF